MLKGLRVPTHRVDAPGVYIFPLDSAWDSPRVDAELEQLVAMKLAEVKRDAVQAAAREAGVEVDALSPEQVAAAEASCRLTVDEEADARARHPVARYHAGATRYQLDAPDQGPNGPASARDYLRPDVVPLEIVLRRVPWRLRMSIENERDNRARWESWVREGVAAVRGDPDLAWSAKRPGEHLPDHVLDALCEAEGSYLNLIALAGACSRYSAPLREDNELPR